MPMIHLYGGPRDGADIKVQKATMRLIIPEMTDQVRIDSHGQFVPVFLRHVYEKRPFGCYDYIGIEKPDSGEVHI